MKIEHDLHIHTNLSMCANETATVENYINAAKHYNLKKIAFTNHYWDDAIDGANGFYMPQNFNHLELIKPDIKKVKDCGIEILFGCEGEYVPQINGISITEKTAEKFDFIIIPNSHTHMTMGNAPDKKYHADFMVKAYEDIITCSMSKYINAIAHPFNAVCCNYANELFSLISDDTFKRLFDLTAQKNIAIEINMGCIKKYSNNFANAPQLRMFTIAKEAGCKFYFGSDSHQKDGQALYLFNNASLVADVLGLKEDDLADFTK